MSSVSARRVRKGTRSCWQCRHRKVRCVYRDPADAVCAGCKLRGTACISQDLPEEASPPVVKRRGRASQRIGRVEALVEQLIEKIDASKTPDVADLCAIGHSEGQVGKSATPTVTPTSIVTPAKFEGGGLSSRVIPSAPASTNGSALAVGEKHIALSKKLHSLLPTPADARLIYQRSNRITAYFNHMMVMPCKLLEDEELPTLEEFYQSPEPSAHPVLIATRMLTLAMHLQTYREDDREGAEKLSMDPAKMMEQMVEAVGISVCGDDELVGTLEGLQCLIHKAVFLSNNGSLRRAWLDLRRCIAVAQLLNLHVPNRCAAKALDPNNKAVPQIMWFRIIYIHHFISLLLGLPQGAWEGGGSITEAKWATEHHPIEHYGYLHSCITLRILNRNAADPFFQNLAMTQEIDIEIQKAASIMPPRWWQIPNISDTMSDKELFWTVLRMTTQFFHFHLLNQLHLPYILRSVPTDAYHCRRVICVTASRELLTRFIRFRRVSRIGFCCRTADFFALLAAITLLIAHIDSRRLGPNVNFLAHQRLSDRGLVEEALDCMAELSQRSKDMLSRCSADVLRRLLYIEADGPSWRAESIPSSPAPPADGDGAGDDDTLHIHVPYFGTVRIAREGTICMATEGPANETAGHHSGGVETTGTTLAESLAVGSAPGGRHEPGDAWAAPVHAQGLAPSLPSLHQPGQQLSYQNASDPYLIADAEEWAFQGVDAAFFDNLRRGADLSNYDLTGFENIG